MRQSVAESAYRRVAHASANDTSESWGSPASQRYAASSYQATAVSSSLSQSFAGDGGWSLPRSSIRSVSGSSRSRSGSRSDDGSSEPFDVDTDLQDPPQHKSGFSSRGRWKREEEEMVLGFSVREEDEDEEDAQPKGRGRLEEQAWDGMDMEMEMD